ncbi:MAG: glucose-1-phosphate adenylyltransferase subunit GlgD [Lachnospiraceae bacterium]|nr:glucose-1-phosphate adenylyltransferase subunit GlgD [Lachnospiraceae bacterium]
MYDAFGIINPSSRQIWVEGLEDYRSIGAFSFLGRYRIIDFPISNMSNSGIDRIQVYIRRKPRSLTDHLGTGRHYNINSKRGRLQVLFSDHHQEHDIYNTDISSYADNLESIELMHHPYVVIAPSYMVCRIDYAQLIQTHIDSGADITLAYHTVDNAKEAFLSCNTLELNRQKGVLGIEPNHGNAKVRNIFMDTYVMKKEYFIDLVKKAQSLSSMYTLSDIVNLACREADVRGFAHHGFFASITDFKSYYDANLELIDFKSAMNLFDDEWPFYTKTNDSCPTKYYETAAVTSSVISNGCLIEGSIENSVIGRGCVIKKGAVVKNSIILSGTIIGEDVHVENQIVDKMAKLIRVKEIIADPENPGYIRRGDTI